jgi:hypothetical protein
MRKSITTGKKLIGLGFYVIFLHKNKMMNAGDYFWYGILIVSEVMILPARVGYDIVERANKTYKNYKPGTPGKGLRD